MVYVYKKSFAAGEVLRAADVNTYLTSSRNLLLNGDFSINQRAYVSGTNLASGVYGFDRWKSNFTNTTLTFTAAPQGQMVTINSGGGLKQVVEQANIVSNSYTLSWDGTATGRVYKSGTTAPAYASSPITVSLDGTGNVDVEFTASDGTKTLHNVQLEIGSSATPFSRAGGTLQGELVACQRYCQLLDSWFGFGEGTTAIALTVQFITEMYGLNPTLDKIAGSYISWRTAAGSDQSTNSWSIVAPTATRRSCWVLITGLTSIVDNQPYTNRNTSNSSLPIFIVTSEL